jgi:hypothetical protein
MHRIRPVLLWLFTAIMLLLSPFARSARASSPFAPRFPAAASLAVSSASPGLAAPSATRAGGSRLRQRDAARDVAVVDQRQQSQVTSTKGFRFGGGSPDEAAPCALTAAVGLPRALLAPALSRRGPPGDFARSRPASTPSSPRDPPVRLL